MSKETLNSLVKAIKPIAVAVFGIGKKVGDLNQLQTQTKTSVVDAINDLHTQASQQVGESRVTELINERLATITNGATTAFDTLKEVEDHLTKGNTATSAILDQIATIKQDITVIKEFIGIEQSSDLETTINNALTTGE